MFPQPPEILEISSRLRGAINGTGAMGASCNTYVLEDNCESIADALRWSLLISKAEGAPTIIMSALRPKDAPLSRGGTSSGVIPFARMFDSVAAGMLRAEKKNGVIVLFLDADHPEILEWLKLAPTLQRAYTGVLFRPGKKYSPDILATIASAYDRHQVTFLCKVTQDDAGNDLYPNVCTEIRQPHKGVCTLSAIKIYELAHHPVQDWVDAGVAVGEWMECAMEWLVKPAIEAQPDLYYFEKQVGIGLVGLANLLALEGVSYEDFALAGCGMCLELLDLIEAGELSDEREITRTLCSWVSIGNPATQIWCKYFLLCLAVKQQLPGYSRIFTQQPTAHTALRLKCKHGKKEYSVAPEIAPPIAVRGTDGLSRATQFSELKGNKELVYHGTVELQSEVPHRHHHQIAETFQRIWDILGVGHTLSFSTYQDKFDRHDLEQFLVSSALGSLYYRLVPQRTEVFSKADTLDDEGDLSDLFGDDDEQVTGFCPMNPADRAGCESCSM